MYTHYYIAAYCNRILSHHLSVLNIMTNKLERNRYKLVVLFVFQRIWGVIRTVVVL